MNRKWETETAKNPRNYFLKFLSNSCSAGFYFYPINMNIGKIIMALNQEYLKQQLV